MSSRSIDDLRDLSDEDVRLLYDIVRAAESSQAPPIRALFAAYDKILAQHGISKEHDQLYLRFLLRMGEGRKEGKGLYEQFETLLERLGLQVAFDEDKESEIQTEDRFDGQDQDVDPSTSPPRIRLLQTASFRPARRASFDSAYDTNTESKPLLTLPTVPARARSTDSIPTTTPTQQNSGASKLKSQSQPSSRPISGVKRPNPEISNDREPHESDETLAEESEDDKQADVTEPSEISLELLKDHFVPSDGENEVVKIQTLQLQENSNPHKSQLESNARTLRFHHVAAQAVRVFRNWYDLAQETRYQHRWMNEIANRHDSLILLRQAFDQWRNLLKEKRQRTETERIFLNIEHQASTARDMYLLTKAFTHWAQCASDEVHRRTEARSKMLQTRYFKAWRDITAVNEIKVRRLMLSKFLSRWIQRTEQVYHQEEQALQCHESTTLAHAYRKWFWQFCEHRTPAWYTSKLQAKVFRKWLDSSRENQTREVWASDFRSLELAGRSFNQWIIRSNMVQESLVQAENFRRRALLGITADALQREIQFVPLQSELSIAIDWRVARSAFVLWTTKTRMIMQAKLVDRLRIMRNAWTQWNDKLRCRALAHVIDDRVVLQALYKWVLAERLALCQKSADEELKERITRIWLGKLKSKAASLGEASHSLALWKEQRSKLSVLKLWSIKNQTKQEEEKRAQSVCDHNLLSKAFNWWNSDLERTSRLNKWSNDARFYVLCSKSLKLWHSATLATKKNRRREAFANFRVKVKMDHAKNIIQRWQGSARSILDMQEQATQAYEQRLLKTGTELFRTWRQRLSVIQTQNSHAHAVCDEYLLVYCMDTLTSRFKQIQDSESRADELASAHLENTASSCLKRLNWKTFQLKRHHESAELLHQRTQRRHYRDMLRYWATSAKQRRQQRLNDGDNSLHGDVVSMDVANEQFYSSQLKTSASRRRTPFGSVNYNWSKTYAPTDATRHVDSSLPLTIQPVLPSTPGYLRTPSRRTASSRLATQTPATSTITPFMSRLRAQYSTGATSSNKYLVSAPSGRDTEPKGNPADVDPVADQYEH